MRNGRTLASRRTLPSHTRRWLVMRRTLRARWVHIKHCTIQTSPIRPRLSPPRWQQFRRALVWLLECAFSAHNGSGCFDFYIFFFFPNTLVKACKDVFCANAEWKKLDWDNVRCRAKESVTPLGERRRKHNRKTHLTLWLRKKKRLLHPIYRW